MVWYAILIMKDQTAYMQFDMEVKPMTEKEMFADVDQSRKKELRDKAFACKTPEEAYALLKEAGMKGSMDDFKKYALLLKQEEISDNGLSNVAGGTNSGKKDGNFWSFDHPEDTSGCHGYC